MNNKVVENAPSIDDILDEHFPTEETQFSDFPSTNDISNIATDKIEQKCPKKYVIEVGSYNVVAGRHHLYIVIRSDDENTGTLFRGGPYDAKGYKVDEDDRIEEREDMIEVVESRYEAGNRDYDKGDMSKHVQVAKDLDEIEANSYKQSFRGTQQRINNSNTKYKTFGPNSNTCVRSMLRDAGLPEQKPSVKTPGWDTPIPW